MMRRTLSLWILAGSIVAFAWGCEDDQGATQGDVDTSLAEHSSNAAAHHAKTTNASELTAGILDSARLDPALSGAVSANTTGVATNVADIATNTGDIATNAGNITTNTGDIATNAGNIATNTGDIATNVGNIATNAADILDRVDTAGDTMTGNLTVPDLVFAAPKTQSVSLQGSGLRGADATTVLAFNYMGNGFTRVEAGTPAAIMPVTFPEGATLVALHLRLFDNDGAARAEVQLRRSDGTAGTTLATAGSSDVETGGVMTKSDTALNHTVDYTDAAGYFLVFTQTDVYPTANVGFYSVVVDYQYTSP